MRRPALLDVNVLVALFDADHVNHEAAHAWLAAERSGGWATCAVTENAVVRVLSNPAYSPVALRAAEVAARLRAFTGSGDHVRWADDVSLTDPQLFALEHAAGHQQVTDVHLLGLATHARGRLATFDRRIPLRAVRGAGPEHLAIIPA